MVRIDLSRASCLHHSTNRIVSFTETTAKPLDPSLPLDQPGTPYLLDGFKWFSSALDGEIAVALARTGPPNSGNGGLSLFLLPLKSKNGQSNGVFVHRLKNKFGTKTLPTAELELSNSVGYLIGNLNQGVRTIAPVLNITRIHSSTDSLGSLGRSISIAKAFAKVRTVRGKTLDQSELHTFTLSRIIILYKALLNLVFTVVLLLGKSEVEESKMTEVEKSLLRLLTPVLKAFCAARSCGGMLEMMEGRSSTSLQNNFSEDSIKPWEVKVTWKKSELAD